MEPLLRNTKGTQGPMNVSTKQQRIAMLAKQKPNESFTSLNHYIDLEWLRGAFKLVKKKSAPGVDGISVTDYEKNLDSNLRSLLERAKSGKYIAPPVKRVHIPKGDGKETRPIGVPTIEDKVLQRAVAMLLDPIYEQDFLNCSHGFRLGQSAHGALSSLRSQVIDLGAKWILDVDVSKFFDTLDHAHLRQFLKHRVRDGVIMKLVGKWLNAGVSERGNIHFPKGGCPQGGVISPILSNVYLHYVLDQWFDSQVRPRMHGRVFMVRFADDFVIGFERKEDAERVLEVLHKRFEKYGLKIHPDKTSLVPFGKPRGSKRVRTETFDFLGFTHYWAKSHRGFWVVKRKTARSRISRGLKQIAEWCRKNRHRSIVFQHKVLCQKFRGHLAYFAIRGNSHCIQQFREEVVKIWRKWLNRRSRGNVMPWERFRTIKKLFPLPPARIMHFI
jgi:RNA-directed DNA polymerase